MTQGRCPTCKRPLDQRPRRVCFDCGVPIARHHKWTFQVREGIMTIVHRVCEHPTMSVTPAEYRKRCGDKMADRMGVPAA